MLQPTSFTRRRPRAAGSPGVPPPGSSATGKQDPLRSPALRQPSSLSAPASSSVGALTSAKYWVALLGDVDVLADHVVEQLRAVLRRSDPRDRHLLRVALLVDRGLEADLLAERGLEGRPDGHVGERLRLVGRDVPRVAVELAVRALLAHRGLVELGVEVALLVPVPGRELLRSDLVARREYRELACECLGVHVVPAFRFLVFRVLGARVAPVARIASHRVHLFNGRAGEAEPWDCLGYLWALEKQPTRFIEWVAGVIRRGVSS